MRYFLFRISYSILVTVGDGCCYVAGKCYSAARFLCGERW